MGIIAIENFLPEPPAYRIIVCGSREWEDALLIEHELMKIKEQYRGYPTIIVHGAGRGADSLADHVAKTLRLEVEPHPADWSKYGKIAGFLRNQEMADLGAQLCLVFKDGIDESLTTGGTEHMMVVCMRRQIPIRHIYH